MPASPAPALNSRAVICRYQASCLPPSRPSHRALVWPLLLLSFHSNPFPFASLSHESPGLRGLAEHPCRASRSQTCASHGPLASCLPQAGAMPSLTLSVAFLFLLWIQLRTQGVAWGPGVVTCPLEGDVKGTGKDVAIQPRPTFAFMPLSVSGKEGEML